MRVYSLGFVFSLLTNQYALLGWFGATDPATERGSIDNEKLEPPLAPVAPEEAEDLTQSDGEDNGTADSGQADGLDVATALPFGVEASLASLWLSAIADWICKLGTLWWLADLLVYKLLFRLRGEDAARGWRSARWLGRSCAAPSSATTRPVEAGAAAPTRSVADAGCQTLEDRELADTQRRLAEAMLQQHEVAQCLETETSARKKLELENYQWREQMHEVRMQLASQGVVLRTREEEHQSQVASQAARLSQLLSQVERQQKQVVELEEELKQRDEQRLCELRRAEALHAQLREVTFNHEVASLRYQDAGGDLGQELRLAGDEAARPLSVRAKVRELEAGEVSVSAQVAKEPPWVTKGQHAVAGVGTPNAPRLWEAARGSPCTPSPNGSPSSGPTPAPGGRALNGTPFRHVSSVLRMAQPKFGADDEADAPLCAPRGARPSAELEDPSVPRVPLRDPNEQMREKLAKARQRTEQRPPKETPAARAAVAVPADAAVVDTDCHVDHGLPQAAADACMEQRQDGEVAAPSPPMRQLSGCGSHATRTSSCSSSASSRSSSGSPSQEDSRLSSPGRRRPLPGASKKPAMPVLSLGPAQELQALNAIESHRTSNRTITPT